MSMPLAVPQYTWGKQYNVFSFVDIEAADYMQNYAVFLGGVCRFVIMLLNAITYKIQVKNSLRFSL